MPRRTWSTPIEDLPPLERLNEPSHGQEHWYLLASQLVNGLSALDIGSGHGAGLSILAEGNPSQLAGIDPSPLGIGIAQLDLSQIRDKSFDFVMAIDVIEHTKDDIEFLADMFRIARLACFITTPNWNEWRCENPYHVREYTPIEFNALLAGTEVVLLTVGKNRLASPARFITCCDEAEAQFAVLVRSSSCVDERWGYLTDLLHKVRLAELSARLSRLSRWSEEWITDLKNTVGDAAYPISVERAIVWLRSQLCTTIPPLEGELLTLNPAAIIRRGSATPEQEAYALAWLMEKIKVLHSNVVRAVYPDGRQLHCVRDDAGAIWNLEHGLLLRIEQ